MSSAAAVPQRSARTSSHRRLSVSAQSIATEKANKTLTQVEEGIQSLNTEWNNEVVQEVIKGLSLLEKNHSPFIIERVENLKTRFFKELFHHAEGYETETDTESRTRPMLRAASAAVHRATRPILAQTLKPMQSAPGQSQGGTRTSQKYKTKSKK